MSRLLAIETATEACSTALWLDGEVMERFELAPQRQAQLLLPMVEGLLAEAGLTLTALDALAFGRGPGSFTGLRIAAGVVQGLAFGANLPVVPVSTLAALAQSAVNECPSAGILAALDARMHQVYWGAFVPGQDGRVEAAGEELVTDPDQVPLAAPGDWVAVGSGWSVHGDALQQRLSGCTLTLLSDRWPRAAEVARLGAAGLDRGQAVAPEQAQPVYLRNRVVQ